MKKVYFNNVEINSFTNKNGLFLSVNDINRVLNNCLKTCDTLINFSDLPRLIDLSNETCVELINTIRGSIVEYVYIMSTDIDGVYKIGFSKNELNLRVKSLQTGCINTIKIEDVYTTHNGRMLESLVHCMLSDFRVNEREFFRCKLDYIKNIMSIATNTVNFKLHSSGAERKHKNVYSDAVMRDAAPELPIENISSELQIGNRPRELQTEQQITWDMCDLSREEVDIINWLNANVVMKKSALLKLKEVCYKLYGRDIHNHSKNKVKKIIEAWIKDKHTGIQSKFQDTRFNNERYRGWCNLSLIQKVVDATNSESNNSNAVSTHHI